MPISADPTFDPAVAARRLAEAWRHDRLLPDLPPAEQPPTLEAGYAVQDRLARELGEPVAGFKLGLSSPKAMQASGLGRPVTGFMPRSRVHPTGTVLPLSPKDRFLLEVEIAFEVAHEIRPGRAVADVAAIVGAASLSVEIVRSHFVDRSRVAFPTFVADGAGFHRFVRGTGLTLKQVAEIPGKEVRLFRNETEVSSKAPHDQRPDPLASLGVFLAMASERNRTITEGTIVSTGNLILPYETDAPGLYRATFDGASVEFSLEAVPDT